MPDTRLQAILAALLPLLPLLFPDFDDQDETERWSVSTVPYAMAPVPQYISASFAVESIAKTRAPPAREINSSITPEVLADALTESWDDAPPVLQALEAICRNILSQIYGLRLSVPLGWIHWGVTLLVAVLLALVAQSWFTRRKSNPPEDQPVVPQTETIQEGVDTSQLVDNVIDSSSGEQSLRLVLSLSVDGNSGSLPQPHSPCHSTDVLHDERPPIPSTSLHNVPTPPRCQTPPVPLQITASESSLPDLSSTTVDETSILPVAQSLVLPIAPSLGDCSTPQPARDSGSLPRSPLIGEEDMLPPRSSWSLDKACEKSPFEVTVQSSALPAKGFCTTAPSSTTTSPQQDPQPEPGPQMQEPPSTQPQPIVQPRFFLPPPPIQLSPEYYRAAPNLVTEEVIHGVPTDVSERTEEPESDHGSPGTPRACWFSAIRGRLAIVDDRGLTYGEMNARPEDGVMSSPETEAPEVFPLMMPQPLLAVVGPPPLLSARDSRGLGLDLATDGESPEDSDHPDEDEDEDTISDYASKVIASDDEGYDHRVSDGDENDGYVPSDSPTRHLRSSSPSSIHTVVPESEDAQSIDDVSPSELVQASVDIQECPGALELAVLDAAEVEDYLSSSSEWELVEAPSRGRSPEPVRSIATSIPDAAGKSASIAHSEPMHAPQSSTKKPSAVVPIPASRTRTVSRSVSRPRRNTSVVIATTGLVCGRPFALTTAGIELAAEQLTAENAAGDRGRRRCRKSISTQALAKHADRSMPPRDYVPIMMERRNHLDQVPARVDRDIVDGSRYPALANDAQVRRGVCEIGRSRTKTASKATSSVRLEANPVSSSRTRSASVAAPPRISRATSEPPAQRVESEYLPRNGAASVKDQRRPNLARTSYSDIVARGQSQESRMRTQSEQSICSVSAASSTFDITPAASPLVAANCQTEDASAQGYAAPDLKGKGRADMCAVPADPTGETRPSSSATDFSPFAPARTGLLKKVSSHILSKLPRGSRSVSIVTTVHLRDIANSARNKSLQVQGDTDSADVDDVSADKMDVTPATARPSPDSGSHMHPNASCDSLYGPVMGSSGASTAPLRLPMADPSSDPQPSASEDSLHPTADHGQGHVGEEATETCYPSEPALEHQDRVVKSIPLLPRRDRLPSALAHPALSFSAFGGQSTETKELTVLNQDDGLSSGPLASGALVSLGSWSSLSPGDAHTQEASAPGPFCPDEPTKLAPFSPSPSEAGFSSDEGEKSVVRPDIPASDPWLLDVHHKADARTQNRGHQVLPRGLTARRRASTNSIRMQADEEATGESVPGITRRSSARFTGGRFDGMKRNELIH